MMCSLWVLIGWGAIEIVAAGVCAQLNRLAYVSTNCFVVNGARQASDAALVTASAEKKWLNGWSAAGMFVTR